MARIVVTEFVSLDGVMEAPGGEPGFKYPGWTFEFDRGDDGNQFKLDETKQSDGLLIGRRTYESFAGAWPQREGEFAEMFNSMPKFVVSTTLKDPEWNNTTVLASGDATAEVRKLKEDFEGELQVPGSQRLVQELIESDLVDQINLMVFPVILGTGRKVFDEKPERRDLRLKESKVVGDGVVVLMYRALGGDDRVEAPRGRVRTLEISAAARSLVVRSKALLGEGGSDAGINLVAERGHPIRDLVHRGGIFGGLGCLFAGTAE